MGETREPGKRQPKLCKSCPKGLAPRPPRKRASEEAASLRTPKTKEETIRDEKTAAQLQVWILEG
jgi:hypothetical protein